MTAHNIGTREEWLAARRELLAAEKEHTRRADELARRRRELPWVPVEKAYAFDTEDGRKTLAGLFDGRSQLIVYHFMFGPEYESGCPSCSAIADGFNGVVAAPRPPRRRDDAVRVARPAREAARLPRADGLDVPVGVLSRQRLQLRLRDLAHGGGAARRRLQLRALRRHDRGGVRRGPHERGARRDEPGGVPPGGAGDERVRPSDGVVYHTYSAYARGLDGLWGAYQWLDRAPLGRNEEASAAWQLRDRYARTTAA